MPRLRLNCDLGESAHLFAPDGDESARLEEALMPLLDQANIACGGHAGHPTLMRRCVQLALAHDVEIGAHPAYPDPQGFGRRQMKLPHEVLRDWLRFQIGGLDAIVRAEGGRITHVKAHGALYNDLLDEPALFELFLETVAQLLPGAAVMVLALPERERLRTIAAAHAVPLLFEAFADRSYDTLGRLRPRQAPGALLESQEEILAQLETLISPAPALQADTLCLHGDHPLAPARARALRERLGPRSARARFT